MRRLTKKNKKKNKKKREGLPDKQGKATVVNMKPTPVRLTLKNPVG